MKIHEVMQRDPRSSSLANAGQARIRNEDDPQALRELRAELETFVCDGQYGRAIEGILGSFLAQTGQPRQHAAWVSGFYGSGKSHLLKMLGHLWVNTTFSDGSRARTLVPHLPDSIQAHLRELDNRVQRTGKPAFAVAGTLPANFSAHVRLSVLSIILKNCGYPALYPQARFCFWLQDNGWYERVKAAVATTGRQWAAELDRLYVSPVIAQAVMACDPHFAPNETEARKTIREQFPNQVSDISSDEFIQATRRALSRDRSLPLTMLVLDEAQQYIGNSDDRAAVFTDLAEAIQTQTDSCVMLVTSGQAALTDTPQLQRLQGRFRITYQLSDTDVEAVTRKVLLRKKPSRENDVRKVLTENSGEISKHLRGTRLAERAEDSGIILQDYPLLPTRRRFWEECFRAVDAAGTSSQLRSQLRIMDDSLKSIAERDLGALIPSDALFDALSGNLVGTGVLLNETYHKIQAADDSTPEGKLKKRICGLVFLIGKLPREAGADTGIRATPDILADLLIGDLNADSGPFRRQVEELLHAMASSGLLMLVGGEYRMQTTEGAEWERTFHEKAATLRQREAEIAPKRSQYFTQAVRTMTDGVNVLQGYARVPRKLALFQDGDTPPVADERVPVLLRDGWSRSRGEVDSAARSAGQESQTIHIFIPKTFADELRAAIVEEEAASQVLSLRGTPGTPEGLEARSGMQSKKLVAQAARERLVEEIVRNAVVLQGGGNEITGDSLVGKIQDVAQASVARLFPRFGDADHGSWNTVYNRSKQGDSEAFALVGWTRPVDEHPVSIEVVRAAGQNPRGSEIAKTLRAAPYGWPQDAIDAAIVALVRAGVLSAKHNGLSVALTQLDQTKIRTTEFRLVRVRLTMADKIALRSLFTSVGVPARPGEEENSANQFLQKMEELARDAGGEPPLPVKPDTGWIEDIRRLTGAEQLKTILDNKAAFEASIQAWKASGQLALARMGNWELFERMLGHLPQGEETVPLREEAQVLKDRRALLEGENPVPPLRAAAAQVLRAAVTRSYADLEVAWERAMRRLRAERVWHELDSAQQEDILENVGLRVPSLSDISEDETLLDALDDKSLTTRSLEVAAIPRLADDALHLAAEEEETPLTAVRIRAAILESEDDVHEWVVEHETLLMDAIRAGRVSVS